MTRRLWIQKISALGVAAALPPMTWASNYPNKTIRLIVPWGPGNSADVAARILAERLTSTMGVSVIVENRPGANGVVGIVSLVKEVPDGHVLMVTSLGPIVIAPTAAKSLPYNPTTDLIPVAPLMANVMVLVAAPQFPPNSLKEMIDFVRANPGKYAYGTYGPGTFNQLLTSSLARSLGLDLIEVSYKSGSEVHTEVLSGRISLLFDVLSNVSTLIKAKRVKLIAVSATARSPLLPEAPTLIESGIGQLANFTAQAWTGLFAPVRTPREVVDRLNKEVNDALRDPAYRARFESLSADLFAPQSPAEFSNFVKEETRKWEKTVIEVGFKGTQ